MFPPPGGMWLGDEVVSVAAVIAVDVVTVDVVCAVDTVVTTISCHSWRKGHCECTEE